MKKNESPLNKEECTKCIRAVKDAMELLNGKWKLPILVCLKFGTKRFNEIAREVNGITDRTLSKELKELELNRLISRKVYDTFPRSVQYTITDHGLSLDIAIDALKKWGMSHRQTMFGKS